MTGRKVRTPMRSRGRGPSNVRLDAMIEQATLDTYGESEQIVAICTRGKKRQRVLILDLPLPSTPPEGAEWIAAFRRWTRGGR